MLTYILDDQQQPVVCDDLSAWGRWMQRAERHVARTEFDGGYVSTVFLGMDHSFTGGPPVLWETMIFGGPHDGWQDRYTSLDAAKAGHAHAVKVAVIAEGTP